MSVASPPNTIPVDAATVEGQVDVLFHTFFSRGSRAALLACDDAGVDISHLLFRPKSNWTEAVRVAAHQRPVARSVDIESYAQLRFNMAERHRQQLFFELFRARAAVVKQGNFASRWEAREAVLNSNGLLRERMAQHPLPESPSDEGADDASSSSDGEGAAHQTPATSRAGHRSHPQRSRQASRQSSAPSRTPRAASKPVPPSFPAPPAPAPICRRLAEDTIRREEALLMDSLKALTDYAQHFIAAERKVRRHVERQKAAKLLKQSEEEPQASQRIVLPSVGRATPQSSATTRSPRIAETLRTARSEASAKAAEKELSALVRMTMSRISSRAIADQQGARLDEERSTVGSRDLVREQAALRRLASSPAAHSVRRTPRPPTSSSQHGGGRPVGGSARHTANGDGASNDDPSAAREHVTTSDDLAQRRRDAEKSEVLARSDRVAQQDVVRASRSERVKAQLATRQLLAAQSEAARRDVARSNRDRAARAEEARRLAAVETREQKRVNAQRWQAQRREAARAKRQTHVEMQDTRTRVADAINEMAIRGSWTVPAQLRELLGLPDDAATDYNEQEQPQTTAT